MIGKDLIELKEQLGHGMFETWINEHFEMSNDSALNFMRVAIAFPQIPNYSVFKPTILYELAKPSTPTEVREQVIEKVEAGESIAIMDSY